MARMHARRKGKSGSKHPLVSESPAWMPLTATEIEGQIVKMAKDGNNSAKIGLVLRDQYGVPDVKLATGKSITAIMKENNVMSSLPEDLSNLMRRAIDLNVHLRDNKGDVSNKRGGDTCHMGWNLALVEGQNRFHKLREQRSFGLVFNGH